MKKRIALFENINHNFISARVINNVDVDFGEEYIQISESVEIDFPAIDVNLTAAKVAMIDNNIEKANAGINLLKQARAELLAIPDMRGEDDE